MSKKNKIILIISCVILLSVIFVPKLIFSHYYNQLNYKTEEEISSEISKEDLDSFVKEEQDENAVDSSVEDIEKLEEQIKNNIAANKDKTEEDIKEEIKENTNNETNKEEPEEIPSQKDNIKNILLIGTDNRYKNDGRRSDAMMVLTINTDKKTITLTSILRDIYVEIPGYNKNKLNASYAFGGVSLLKNTLKQNFNIDIDNFIVVDFYEFIEIVDILGGVDLEITKDEKEYINQYVQSLNVIQKLDKNTNTLKDYGLVHLNGAQALGYSRIRYIGTDFGRTERQRKVLFNLYEKVKSSDLATLNKLYFKIAPNITTDLKEDEILDLLFKMSDYKKYDITTGTIPYKGTYEFLTINKMSVIGIDFKTNIDKFYETIYR